MFEMVFEVVDDEMNMAVLATAEPSAQNETAIPTLGLAILSLMCGAQEIATMAAAAIRLYTNNSDQAVGNSRSRSR